MGSKEGERSSFMRKKNMKPRMRVLKMGVMSDEAFNFRKALERALERSCTPGDFARIRLLVNLFFRLEN